MKVYNQYLEYVEYESAFTLQPGVNYILQVSASKGEIPNTTPKPFERPILTTGAEVISFNLASKSTSLSYKTVNTTKVVYLPINCIRFIYKIYYNLLNNK